MLQFLYNTVRTVVNMASYLGKSGPPDKKFLLQMVTRKIFRLTQDLQELDILDYNFSKNAKRVTLSIGFKEDIKDHQKFDLSPMFTFHTCTTPSIPTLLPFKTDLVLK